MPAKYVEIASELRFLIEKGLMPIGTQLSERKLAAKYKTGRFTITSAFNILKEEGYLESTAKSITMVCKKQLESSIWDKFVKRGVNIEGSEVARSTVRYITQNDKIGTCLSLHDSFKPNEPIKKAMRSVIDNPKVDEYLNMYNPKGLPILREELVRHLKNYDIHADIREYYYI